MREFSPFRTASLVFLPVAEAIDEAVVVAAWLKARAISLRNSSPPPESPFPFHTTGPLKRALYDWSAGVPLRALIRNRARQPAPGGDAS